MTTGSRETDAGPDSPSNATPIRTSPSRAVRFDPDDDRKLGTLVVETVAGTAGIDPTEMDRPLYETLDPDALDALFRRRSNGEPRPGGRIEFEVAGRAVTVHAEGLIEVAGRRAAASPESPAPRRE